MGTTIGSDHTGMRLQRAAQRVIDCNYQHIIMRRQRTHQPLGLPIGAIQVTDQHHQVIMGRATQRNLEGGVQRDCATVWLPAQGPVHPRHFVQQVQHAVLAAVRPDIDDAGLVEHDTADPIPGRERAPGTERRYLGRGN